MKILVKVVSVALLLLIILPIVAALSLSIPSVQNYAVNRVAGVVSNTLGTKVSIDHITLGLLNRVCVRGFYVEDLDGDTLIYAGKVTAYIGSIKFNPTQLNLLYGEVADGKCFLRETERGPMNIKEVVDLIPRKKNKVKKPFELHINNLHADNIEFRLNRLKKRNPEFGVDYGAMQILGITGEIADFTINGGAVGGNIEHLTFTERSGFVADRVTGNFLVDKGLISVTPMTITTARSEIRLSEMRLTGEDWSVYKDFINCVRLDIEVEDSRVTSDDVGYFAPSLLGWHTSLRNTKVAMHGTVADFMARIDNARLEDGGTLAAEAVVRGLIDVPKTKFNIKVKKLSATTAEVTRLLENIAHLSLPVQVEPYIERIGRVNLAGWFDGTIRSFKSAARVGIGCGGTMKLVGEYAPEKEGHRISANVDCRAVPLGVLLAAKAFGDISFDARFDGENRQGEGFVVADGDVRVSNLNLLEYDYKDISLEAALSNQKITGSFRIDDEALLSEGVASIDLSESAPGYDAVVDIRRADLHAMNINRRDSVSVLSTGIGLSLRGRDLDSMNGEISMAESNYKYNDTEIGYDMVALQLDSNEDARTINLTSDFADAVFECRTNYRDVVYYIKDMLNRYMPAIYDEQTRLEIMDRSEDLRRHAALLSVTTKRINPLLDALATGLEVADGTLAQVYVNPASNRFLMRAVSDFIAKDNYMVTELKMNLGNRNDSLAMKLSAADLYVGSLHLPSVTLDGGAKSDQVALNATFNDTIQDMQAFLGLRAAISRNMASRHMALRVMPSYLSRKGSHWKMLAKGIELDSSRVAISDFRIVSDNQELCIDGVASRLEEDSLKLTLRDFDLAPLLQVASRLGYDISGRSNGYVTMNSVMKDSRIDAHIAIDRLSANGINLPDLQLASRWDFGRSRARLNVDLPSKDKTILTGYFSPSKKKYYAELKLDSLPMNLLDPILTGVVSQTKGLAEVDVVMRGENRMANLSGAIRVHDLSTMVDYTQCTYHIPVGNIRVENNHLLAKDVPMYDIAGNRGALSMDLSLNHLSNVEYNFGLSVNNMQVLKTTERDNDMFYGDIKATGRATIKGDKSGVVMDIAASTADNTHFFMPLSGKSSIRSADFVTFERADAVDTTSYLVRKKLMFERRNKRGASGGSSMEINLALDVRSNAEAQLVIDPTVGDVIKAKGAGMFNLRINPRKNIFEMYGDYTIDEGSYLFTLQNVINKRFTINRGSTIQWTGEPLDARLGIDAIYKLKASLQPLLEGSVAQSNTSTRAVPVECVIHLTDRLTRPMVDFDVIVPNVDSEVQSIISNSLSTPESRSQQFLYLLVANSFISESSSSTSSSIGASTATTTGFELLSNQLSNWLSTDDYNVVIRYRPKTEMTSDEVDFGFSKGLINNRLLIEVEGNYIADRAQMVNSTSNFTGEAYITWLIDRAGTLRLKGFTHTIDRFDENQGLQETGLGVYYKEDFDNFKDFKNRVKWRFMSKRRRERIMGEREAAERAAADSLANGVTNGSAVGATNP